MIPYLHVPLNLPGGDLVLQMKARTPAETDGGIYWATDRSGRSEAQAVHFPLHAGGQWHEYTIPFTARGRLIDLRLDPGEKPGEFEIEWIRLGRRHRYPLALRQVRAEPGAVRFTMKNEDSAPCRFEAAGKTWSLDGGAAVDLRQPIPGVRPLEAITLAINPLPPGHPRRFRQSGGQCSSVMPRRPGTGSHYPTPPTPPSRSLRSAWPATARWRGSSARGRLVAVLGPLVIVEGELPGLKPIEGGPSVRFQGDGLSVAMSLAGEELSVTIESRRPCEGPVVRPLGPMQQALLAGLEYLSRGERSSSTLDIETDEHLRFAPDPLKVTMPLMAVVTDRARWPSPGTTWRLQPVFATPNFFDGTADHRMALRGKRIAATIRVTADRWRRSILWAVRRRGLPPLPPPPRTEEQQRELCLAALGGPLRNEAGWGHCVEPTGRASRMPTWPRPSGGSAGEAPEACRGWSPAARTSPTRASISSPAGPKSG